MRRTDGSTRRGGWLALAVLAGLAVVLTTAAPAAAGQTCGGRPATHTGTNGNNDISTGLGTQVVVGLGGRDEISTGPGPDYVCAGDGNDLIDGEQGSDRLLAGGANRDAVFGSTGADQVQGGSEDDCGPSSGRCPVADFQGGTTILPGVYGGGGEDDLFGGDGRDDLFGEASDDALFGGFGVDYLDGGNGGEQGGDTCDPGPGQDFPTVNCNP